MFWKQTIAEMQETELKHYTQCQNRMNKISDYIQGPLAKEIDKAVEKYFKDLKNVIKQQNKKDK